MTLARFAILICALGLSSCTTAPKEPVPIEVLRDIPYAVQGGRSLALDLYRPTGPQAGTLPAVIWIHGGGWRSGSKSESRNVSALAGRGFVGVSLDHRLSSEAPFPAAVDDVKAAVRWLRTHAAEYGVNPDRIGIWGASSGGHLALMAACGGETQGGASSRVQAACAWFPPVDLSNEDLSYIREMVQQFLGDSVRSSKALSASPFMHASADDPPVLLFHGEEDLVVPPSHSRVMVDALRRAGAEAKLVLVKHATHGFDPIDGEPDPSKEEILEDSIEFFEDKLK